MKSDVQLHTDIAEELRHDPGVDHKHIAISVSDGIVTLTGSVPSVLQRLAAEQAVKRVSGVRGFAEDVAIELPSMHHRDDTDLARAAADALSWHITLPEGLRAMVRSGIVTLEGEVDWQYQREEAARAVCALIGVRAINNLIQLKPRDVNPSEVRLQIERQLGNLAQGTANRIAIESNEGHVILRGFVHSVTEKDEATMAAWRTPGVVAVENVLQVAAS